MAGQCPITNLEKILLSSDGSEYSQGAIKEAVNLARRCSSKLVAMAVVEANEEYASEAPQLVEKEEIRAKEHLDSVREMAQNAGVECETVVHLGDRPWKLIIDEAKKMGAELIVMGRRGRTGLARVAMGSVTAGVIGHAPCDVLVVPRAAKVEYKAIMAATDGSVFGDGAVAEAAKMASKCGSDLTIISVAGSDSDIKTAEQIVSKAKEMAAAYSTEAKTMTASGKAYRQILAAAQEKKADIIVMGCHGRTGVAQLLMGSVTDRVIGHADRAVMVACAPAQ